MTHDFDEHYWEQHWQQAPRSEPGDGRSTEPNPHLVRETGGLPPGTALDAGCGEGAEAIWLASRGWQVTAADISADALARAADRVAARVAEDGPPLAVQWLRADLSVWDPATQFDLVTTHYAHPSMTQLAFYDRLSGWVAPGGTLLIVGHLHTEAHGHEHEHSEGHEHAEGHEHSEGHEHEGHKHEPPAEATVTLADITAGLDASRWEVVTAEEHLRSLSAPGGRAVQLHDVVVRATRRS